MSLYTPVGLSRLPTIDKMLKIGREYWEFVVGLSSLFPVNDSEYDRFSIGHNTNLL